METTRRRTHRGRLSGTAPIPRSPTLAGRSTDQVVEPVPATRPPCLAAVVAREASAHAPPAFGIEQPRPDRAGLREAKSPTRATGGTTMPIKPSFNLPFIIATTTRRSRGPRRRGSSRRPARGGGGARRRQSRCPSPASDPYACKSECRVGEHERDQHQERRFPAGVVDRCLVPGDETEQVHGPSPRADSARSRPPRATLRSPAALSGRSRGASSRSRDTEARSRRPASRSGSASWGQRR
jgi:hypothetical protein